jgi:hypothetical protein
MKRSDYLTEVTDRVGPDGQALCEDCGKRSMIIHGIVDHDTDRVKVVCNDCYLKTYLGWLHGKKSVQ